MSIDVVAFVVKALFRELISYLKVFIRAFHSCLTSLEKWPMSPDSRLTMMLLVIVAHIQWLLFYCVTGTNT